MRIDDNHPECRAVILPVKDTLDVISGKWKVPILIALELGNKRFMELHNSIPGITSRMLSKELKELEANHLVERKVFDSYPVTIEYHISEHGKSLNPLIEEMRRWGEYHRAVTVTKTA